MFANRFGHVLPIWPILPCLDVVLGFFDYSPRDVNDIVTIGITDVRFTYLECITDGLLEMIDFLEIRKEWQQIFDA